VVVERLVLFTGLVSGYRELTVWGPSSGALPICKTSFVFRGKGCMKRCLKTGSNIITDVLNKEPEQRMDNIFKTRFSQAQGNLEGKIKK
jgi:hypothetical protein